MTWTYRYKTDAGLMKQTSLGRWPAVSSHEAVSAWLSTRDTRRQTGVDPHAERLTQRGAAKAPEMFGSPQTLIAGFLADYIDKERKAESAGAARSMLERLLTEEPEIAKCPIDSISRSMAYSLIQRRSEFPEAAKKLRSLLGQAWDYGRDAGLISADLPNHWRDIMHGRLRSKGKIVKGQHQGKVHRTLSTDASSIGELSKLSFTPVVSAHLGRHQALLMS